MKLGMQVGFGLGHIVLDGDPAPLRTVILKQYRRVTNGQTDGNAIAGTELAMRALRRAVKTGSLSAGACGYDELTKNRVLVGRLPLVGG